MKNRLLKTAQIITITGILIIVISNILIHGV